MKPGRAAGVRAATTTAAAVRTGAVGKALATLKDSFEEAAAAPASRASSVSGATSAGAGAPTALQVEKLAAFKAILGGTTVETTLGDARIAIKDNRLSAAQLAAAVKAVFGPRAQLSADGTFALGDAHTSVVFVSQLTAAFRALTLDAQGDLALKDGNATAAVKANLQKVLGPVVVLSGTKVELARGLEKVALDEDLVAKFGSFGTLGLKGSATIDVTPDAKTGARGVREAELFAAYKAIVGGTRIDTTGTKLTIKDNALTEAQLRAAAQAVFGPSTTLEADGTLALTQAGISAQARAQFRALFSGTTLDADGDLALKDGKLSGPLAVALKSVIGNTAVVAQAKILFAGAARDSATVADLQTELTTKLGPNATLAASAQAKLDAAGIREAELLAAFKTLVGSTTLDTAGSKLTIKDNRITAAQLEAAVKTVFGRDASLAADGSFDWTQSDGVRARTNAQFRALYHATRVDAGGDLVVRGGKLDGALAAAIHTTLGPSAFVSDNRVVFTNNRLDHATLNAALTTSLGPTAALNATAASQIDATGIRSAELLAAYKALLGGTTIDVSGAKLTLKDNRLTAAQLDAAVKTVFGPGAELAADGSFSWTQAGVSAEAKARFTALVAGMKIDADGDLALKEGKLSGNLAATLEGAFGPATFVSRGKVVYVDSKLESASFNTQLEARFGKQAQLNVSVQAHMDAHGIADAQALAAFKAIVGGTTIDTTGTRLTIKDNRLTEAQLRAALKTVLGAGAELAADGSFVWTESGVSADMKAKFDAVYSDMTIDAEGDLAFREGKLSGELAMTAQALLGPATFVSGAKVVVTENRFDSATVTEQLALKFGPQATLNVSARAVADAKGIREAQLVAAFKAIVGSTTLDTSGTRLLIKDNAISEAQLRAAVKTVFGQHAELRSDSSFAWTEAGLSADAKADFAALLRGTTINAQGELALKEGKLVGELGAAVTRTLGTSTAVVDGKIRFANGVLQGQINEQLLLTYGPNASVAPSFLASFSEDGTASAAIGLAAFKRLKILAGRGAIELKPDGRVLIKNGEIERAEVSALVTTIIGERVNLSSDGRLVFANGSIDAQVSAQLATALNGTKLDASGTLRIVDGRPEVAGTVNFLFEGAKAKAGGTVEILGADEAKVSLKLSSLGVGTAIDATGSLVFGKNGLTGLSASFTTNLLTSAEGTAPLAVGGMIIVTDKKKAADIKAQIDAGVFKGSIGVGAGATVEPYEPGADDPARRAVAQSGGHWSMRSAEYHVSGGADVDVPVLIAGVPIKLGFGAKGAIERQVRTLTIHPTEEDAAKQAPISVLRPPDSLESVLAMQPHEMISVSGEQTLGFGGSVAVGLDTGPARASVSGQVYYTASGKFSRDIERLEGNRVRLRFRRGDGKVTTKALNASVGLEAPGVLASNSVGKSLAPVVEQIAQVGLNTRWEHLKEEEACFDFTIDLSTEHGRAALEHALKNEVAEAQYWSEFAGSGVSMNSAMETQVDAHTRTTDVSLGVVRAEDVERWADKVSVTLKPGRLVYADVVQRDSIDRSLLPWRPTLRSTVKFVRHKRMEMAPRAPKLDAPTTSGPLTVRLPPPDEIVESRQVSGFGFRLRLEDTMTSLADLQDGYLRPALAIMEALGFSSEERATYERLHKAVAVGGEPARKPILPLFGGGLGDKRFGASALDFEGFIAPRGFIKLFERQDASGNGTTPRTRGELISAYLDMESRLTGKDASKSSSTMKRARAFAEEMLDLVALFEKHRQALGDAGPLLNDSSAYYQQLEQEVRDIMEQDGQTTAALTLLSLAAPDGLYASSKLEMTPEATQSIIEAERRDVLRFGAVALLAQGGGVMARDNRMLVVTPGKGGKDEMIAAAKQLFGDDVKVEDLGHGSIGFSRFKAGSKELCAGLAALLDSVKRDGKGGMTVPAGTVLPGDILDKVFGPEVATIENGRLLFDNRAQDLVDIQEALTTAYGPTPPLVPTVVPASPKPGQQPWIKDALTVQHKGKDASWKFVEMAEKYGSKDDLAAAGASRPAWVMT